MKKGEKDTQRQCLLLEQNRWEAAVTTGYILHRMGRIYATVYNLQVKQG